VNGGETTPSGHVRIWWRGRKEYVHRIAYELAKGPIEIGVVCHSCDFPRCCRPSCLRDSDAAGNVRDRDERNRRTQYLPVGENHWSAKLTNAEVRKLRTARNRRFRRGPGNALRGMPIHDPQRVERQTLSAW
jgi:hypothetical protein